LQPKVVMKIKKGQSPLVIKRSESTGNDNKIIKIKDQFKNGPINAKKYCLI